MSEVFELTRQSDGDALLLHFTGGFQAAKVADNAWRIVPVLVNNRPCITSPLTMDQLIAVAKQNNFQASAFHQFGWMDGTYHSSWTPIVPGKTNHTEGPSELWRNIARNIARPRTKEFFENVARPTLVEIAKALDDQNPVEALARYISLSLRSMDISVEQIAQHYHEQLVNHMVAGRIAGERSANTLSQTLYAHVHSFFLHLGAARDYLGVLIAYRIGLDPIKVDSLARLVGALQSKTLPMDALLDLLFLGGNIATHPQKLGKFAVSGWVEEVTSIRNELVHKRPYGSKFSELTGWVIPTQKDAGLFRYFRPLESNNNTEQDVLDVIHHHYSRCTDLMYQAAIASGYVTQMMQITDEDVVSFDVR